MKRIHMFEFEDLSWFPVILRRCITDYLVALHRLVNTQEHLIELLGPVLAEMPAPKLVDLCSGSGGPMPKLAEALRTQPGLADLELMLTDLYPEEATVERFNSADTAWLRYRAAPLDAGDVDPKCEGLRTMVCGFHHMPPEVARKILKDAQQAGQPFCSYEFTDNAMPQVIGWLGLPAFAVAVMLITLTVRPFTLRQFVFTYAIPILPFVIAWDACISNLRTYTQEDMQELLPEKSDTYEWTMGTLPGRGGKKLYLLGKPILNG